VLCGKKIQTNPIPEIGENSVNLYQKTLVNPVILSKKILSISSKAYFVKQSQNGWPPKKKRSHTGVLDFRKRLNAVGQIGRYSHK